MTTTNAKNIALKNNLKTDNVVRTERRRKSPMNPVHIFFFNAIVIVTVVWLLFEFVFAFVSAPNNDMSPNIKSGDLLMCYHLNEKVKAQDIVVVSKNSTQYVGRVVASAGDTVDITDNETLVINGNTVIENNVSGSTFRYEGFVNYPMTLGQGEYFVLSDSREGGEDSRYYGAVTNKEIKGKVITVLRRNNF